MDHLLKRRYCPEMSRVEFEAMHTGRLLAFRAKMLSLEDRRDESDLDSEELRWIEGRAEIFFKDDPRWSPQYQVLKRVLSGREHVSSSSERAQQRRQSARERNHGPGSS